MPELKARGVKGGAYIGVGPDQNFSYIAAIRPDVAFIVDVRRDNLLLHLLFKSLFSLARTRVEYLALLLGRQVPADLEVAQRADRTHRDARPVGAARRPRDLGRPGAGRTRRSRGWACRYRARSSNH